MRLATILVVFTTLHLAASTYSQSTLVNISARDASYIEIFNEIEKQSEFRIFYKVNQLDLEKHFDYEAQNTSVSDVLADILSGTDVSFELMDKIIVITPVQKNQISKVTGTVKDANTGEPLIGAYVQVEGTNTGGVTDASGKFSTEVPSGDAVLIFSYVGYLAEKVNVAGRKTIDVTLVPDIVNLDEVVVTALGIERSKKSLNYATELVDMESLTTVKDVDLGNMLSGKVAGVSVTGSTGATGVSGDALIVIRGNRSINNNNQPLIVVDGIPTSVGGAGLTGINPDDVESMNVLKGQSASALYGSSAQNGVIVITTKKGKKGTPQIEFNSSATFDMPYLYPEFQNEYAQGNGGIYDPSVDVFSWGPKMEGQTVTNWTGEETTLTPQKDNVKDFFKTGHTYTNSLSYSMGNEKTNAYFSYANTVAQGVLKDNKMTRNNLNLRLETELIKKLKLDAKISYFNQNIKDRPETGDAAYNPMLNLIKMPRSLRTDDIKHAFYFDESGSRQQNSWDSESTDILNPYYSMYGYESPKNSNTFNSMLSLRYNLTDWLYVQARGGLVSSNTNEEERTFWDNPYINAGHGDYYLKYAKSQDYSGDILISINKKINDDFAFGVSAGSEIKDNQYSYIESTAGGVSSENKFAMSYAQNAVTKDYSQRIQRQSVYGFGQLSFREYLFLDITARNDWSSTLPSPYTYFYPSIGLSGIVSDMFSLPEIITYLKVRGTYAEVGNDAGFARTLQTYKSSTNGAGGMVFPNNERNPLDLIPEKSKSWETGAELKLFGNRLGIDFTWYKTNTYNQLVLVSMAPTSGYGSGWINTGNIQNDGIELVLYGTPIKTNNFSWEINLNYSKNNSKVIELSDDVKQLETNSPNLSIGECWIIEGKPVGELYTRGFQRNDAGQIMVASTGLPILQTQSTENLGLYLGNFNYDWKSAISNNLQYKNWNMSFLIDLNYGGVRGSATEALMASCGTSKMSLKGREDGIIVDGVFEDGTPNNVVLDAEAYYRYIGGRISSGSGELFNHEATNSRLREFSLGYTLPLKSNWVRAVRISAVGRNLFYIYNGCKWFDPDMTYDNTRNAQGAESSFLPGTRTIGFNLKLSL